MVNDHKITAQIKQQIRKVDSEIIPSHVALLYLVCWILVHVCVIHVVKVISAIPELSPDWFIANEETLKDLTKYVVYIWCNYNKTKHNKTMCIFMDIQCGFTA